LEEAGFDGEVNGQVTDGDEGIAHGVQGLRDSGVKGGGGWWRVTSGG
jgi:hypothetical protein